MNFLATSASAATRYHSHKHARTRFCGREFWSRTPKKIKLINTGQLQTVDGMKSTMTRSRSGRRLGRRSWVTWQTLSILLLLMFGWLWISETLIGSCQNNIKQQHPSASNDKITEGQQQDNARQWQDNDRKCKDKTTSYRQHNGNTTVANTNTMQGNSKQQLQDKTTAQWQNNCKKEQDNGRTRKRRSRMHGRPRNEMHIHTN